MISEVGDGNNGLTVDWMMYLLKYVLPYKLANRKQIDMSPFEEPTWKRGIGLMNMIIREEKSWPFVDEFDTIDSSRFFLSVAAFFRSLDWMAIIGI